MWFHYDATGSLTGFELNGSKYFYVKNVQGDIIAIISQVGYVGVEYVYDSWGKLISMSGPGAATVGVKNPLRYRGYYYDTEIGLYYLNSRYYDPNIKRFINADGYAATGQGTIGNNMFSYCGNNSVNRVDFSGAHWISSALEKARKITNKIWGEELFFCANTAAIAFATEIYSSSSYSMHEYSTEIYAITKGESTLYAYTEPAVGSPHSATGLDMDRVENIVAYAHTHPNSNSFSDFDKAYAKVYGVDAYVIGPDLRLQYYNVTKLKTSMVCKISPLELTDNQRAILKDTLKASWDNHMINGVCPDGFRCEKKTWPNA